MTMDIAKLDNRYSYMKYAIDRLYSKLMVEITHSDAISGYGSIYRFCVSVWLIIDTCEKCGLSVLDDYNDERYRSCFRHKWRKKLVRKAVGGGSSMELALKECELDLEMFAGDEGKVLFERFDEVVLQ